MILTSKVRAMEPKMLKETLKDFACFEERFVLAKRTHGVSLLTEGMLVLDKTLMGVIEIEDVLAKMPVCCAHHCFLLLATSCHDMLLLVLIPSS